MPRLIDLKGRVFGRLTVLRQSPEKISGKPAWDCRCACGARLTVRGSDLRQRRSRSCGCLHIDTITKHGGHRSQEYRTWQSMKDRCGNPNSPHYDRYGGRGITVCPRWHGSFAHFLADMGERPSPKHTIERIDNEKGYRPSNCRWATRKEQAQNRAPRRWHTTPERDPPSGQFLPG